MPDKKNAEEDSIIEGSDLIKAHTSRNIFRKVQYGVMSIGEEMATIEKETADEFQKARRTDYAKRTDLRIPQGYHSQVRRIWEMWTSDRLFRYLVDRCVDFGANGFEWEIPIKLPKGILDIIKGKRGKILNKIVKEKAFWDAWSSIINQDVPNVIPGLDEINKWLVKHVLLNGMAIPEWEWGTIEVNGTNYQIPKRLIVHNPLHIALQATSEKFIDEETYLRVSSQPKTKRTEVDTTRIAASTLSPGLSGQYQLLNQMGGKKRASQESFVIKYNWTPGDNSISVFGKSATVGQGLYPVPPFLGLHPFILLRRSLIAADLSILDGVVDFLLWWEIGDNTKLKNPGDDGERLVNQPQPKRKKSDGTELKSTIDRVADAITSDNLTKVMQMFLPYYVKPHILMPNTESLISAEKYAQSNIEILSAFGILIAPKDSRMDIGDLNVANFEEMLEGIRQRHIKRFWEALASEIVERNKGKLTIVPNMIWHPLNTQDNDFRSGLYALAKLGWISKESMLNAYRKDANVEVSRIMGEMARGESKLFDENVPITFKQTAEGKGTSERTAMREGGRPRGEE